MLHFTVSITLFKKHKNLLSKVFHANLEKLIKKKKIYIFLNK